MKELKRLIASSFLVFVFTMSIYAGIIDYPAPQPPPPVASPAVISGEISGDIQLPWASDNSVTDVALNLLQELLLVF